MLVEIKIECVGSTIIQFPPSRRHGWAITCALLCSPYHQLSIGNRSEYLTCFFKYSLWRFKHVIYKFELRMMLHILTWIADANWKHLQACWFRAGHHNEPKNMWKIINSFYKAKCIWSWVMPELMYASQAWPVPEPNDPCGATPCCHNPWNCFFQCVFFGVVEVYITHVSRLINGWLWYLHSLQFDFEPV